AAADAYADALRLGSVSLWGHSLDDALEVVDGGELDGDLALVAAHLYFDPGLEQIRQPVGEVTQRGGDWLGRGWAPGSLFPFVGAEGDDLLDRADRESLGDDPLRQALLGEGGVEREKSTGVAGADHAGG